MEGDKTIAAAVADRHRHRDVSLRALFIYSQIRWMCL